MYGFESLLVTVEDRGAILAALPVMEIPRGFRGRRWVALPFTDRCPPLGDLRHVDALVCELEAARADAAVDALEVREPLPLDGASSTEFVQHVVQLDAGIEAVEGRYGAAVRRAIRRAEASGCRIRLGETEADIAETFYGLHVETRRRLGLPVQPRRFFRHVWRTLGPELCRTVLVEAEGRPVAGLVLLTWNSHAVFKYGASDDRYWSMRPNNLLFADTIKWACANGYTQFDLGRTDLAAETLRRFKRGWGAQESPLAYTRIGPDRRGAHLGSRPLLRAALRRSPKWVVRLSGEVGYRRAA